MSDYERLKLTFALVLAVVGYVSQAFILKKAGYPLWAGLAPVYNVFCLSYSAFGNAYYALLLLIPGVNLIYYVVMLSQLVKQYGFMTNENREWRHDGKYALWLVLLPVVFFPMLAFGPSTYMGKWTGPNPFIKEVALNGKR